MLCNSYVGAVVSKHLGVLALPKSTSTCSDSRQSYICARINQLLALTSLFYLSRASLAIA